MRLQSGLSPAATILVVVATLKREHRRPKWSFHPFCAFHTRPYPHVQDMCHLHFCSVSCATVKRAILHPVQWENPIAPPQLMFLVVPTRIQVSWCKCRQNPHSHYISVQYSFTSAERAYNALGSRVGLSSLCAKTSGVIWCDPCLIHGCSLTRVLP